MLLVSRVTDVVTDDGRKYAVYCVEVHCLNCIHQVLFALGDLIETVIAPADRSLLLLALYRLIDPLTFGALDTEEPLAALAVISDVLEVELALANHAVLSINSLHYQLLHFVGCC